MRPCRAATTLSLALLVGSALAGCAPFHGALRPLPDVPAGARAEVTVVRPASFVGAVLSYVVTVDGVEYFAMRSGDHATMPLPAGERIIAVKCNCGWSPTGMDAIRVTLEPGQHYYFSVSPSLRDVAIERLSEERGRQLVKETQSLDLGK